MTKSFLLVFACFGAFGAFSQEVLNAEPTNTATPAMNNTNGFEYNNTAPNTIEFTEESLDTVSIQIESVDEVRKKKAAIPKRSMSTSPVKKESQGAILQGIETVEEDMQGILVEPISTEQQGAYSSNERANYKFSISKVQATQQRQQRSPSYEQQVEMNKAVDYFEVNAPNSFEFHYFKYVSGNFDISLVDHLYKAAELRPENTDVHVQLAAYNIIRRNADSSSIFLKKLTNSGKLTSNTLHYAEDLLLSAPKNGVLITHGFDDTYGVWKKHQVDGVRSDVQIISLDFMQSEEYRNLLKNDGFKLPTGTVINVKYLHEFCRLNATKNISISLTTPKEYFVPMQSKLYITGLVFEYHESEFKNFDRNDELWNQKLKKHLVDNATDEKAKQLSANYLPMLLQLRKVYKQQEENTKLEDVDAAADKVGLQCKKYEQVQKLKNSY